MSNGINVLNLCDGIDHPYSEYDMRYIDSISCIGTKDGNAVIALE